MLVMDLLSQIDKILRNKVLQKIAERRTDAVEFITDNSLDQTLYAEQRGYLRALRGVEEDILDILNKANPQ